ncbi:MAG: chemotaxis protein CheW [Candidatus Fimivivens sp.]
MNEVEVNNSVQSVQSAVFAGKYLTFYIGKTIYGVALENVLEIIGNQQTTRVPGTPAFVKGIINLRGRILPVIDVRIKMGVEAIEYDERTCIVVIIWNESLVGLIVDRVAEVNDFKNDQIAYIPDFSSVNTNKYLSSICKVGERVVLILDCDKFLADDTYGTHAI